MRNPVNEVFSIIIALLIIATEITSGAIVKGPEEQVARTKQEIVWTLINLWPDFGISV